MKKKIVVIGLMLMSISVVGRVYSGLEVFLAKYVYIVKGKRVGLVTNPTGVDAHLRQTVDLFYKNPRINLTILFAPEHGIRGDIRAGEKVPSGRDMRTGLPVYTLYGHSSHKPPSEGLAKIDILVYDIQDVGSRTYTYIWHLAECMKACAAVGKPVIVLDRPNPLGANVVDGPGVMKQYRSFIGLYSIPRVYGMTVGELARYLNKEEKIKCHLYVVPMLNYRRGMSWKKTGLPWVPTSPNIPTSEAACAFAATGTIGEIGKLNIGVGFTLPFQTVAAPWINAEHAAGYLNSLNLPGIVFRPIHYQPFYGAYKDNLVHGVQLHIVKPGIFYPATTEIAIMCYLRKFYPGQFKWKYTNIKAFDKAMGTPLIRRMIMKGISFREIIRTWQRFDLRFKRKRAKYLIY